VSDDLGGSHRGPVIARGKTTSPGSGGRHRRAKDGLRFQPTARTRDTRPSLAEEAQLATLHGRDSPTSNTCGTRSIWVRPDELNLSNQSD
jgi:hypothetical protein